MNKILQFTNRNGDLTYGEFLGLVLIGVIVAVLIWKFVDWMEK